MLLCRLQYQPVINFSTDAIHLVPALLKGRSRYKLRKRVVACPSKSSALSVASIKINTAMSFQQSTGQELNKA
jgi:hypothetical protein